MSGTITLEKRPLIAELGETRLKIYSKGLINYSAPYQYSSYKLWDKQFRSRQCE